MRSEQDLLSTVALSVFRLNGQVLDVAERLARPAGLTAAWWQVLGAVLETPSTVSGVARQMGITRQSVQRIADVLVDRDLAEYVSNPAHRTARLLRPTAAGLDAVRRINPGHASFAARLVAQVGHDELDRIREALLSLSKAFDDLDRSPTRLARSSPVAG